ncbi:Transposase IS4 [Popillia japonica]|uniref:Transposase IS4 n=1 Tax=Popillia japonica TaxID=7064 RepID=A0AAW1MHU8_POPJA
MEIPDDAVEQPQDSDELYFAAKSDKISIKWRKHPKTVAVKTASVNKVSVRAGVKGDAKQALSILDCWGLYFDQDTIQKIVTFTNIQIDKFREKYARERNARFTNTEEIDALLGTLYAAGVLKSSHVNLEDLWSNDGFAPEIFKSIMSQKKFYFLLRSMRFDDIRTRNDRKIFCLDQCVLMIFVPETTERLLTNWCPLERYSTIL